jgi:hypothetical protein
MREFVQTLNIRKLLLIAVLLGVTFGIISISATTVYGDGWDETEGGWVCLGTQGCPATSGCSTPTQAIHQLVQERHQAATHA